MLQKTIKLLTVVAAIFVLLTAATDEKQTRIFIIGDSTAANKDISNGKQERGWGMALQCYFDDNILVENHAANGHSSLSFINDGHWDKVLEQLKPGDYIIIQFGHNDQKPRADRHTDPGSTFDYNLAKFVRETREHGGIPVLMNSVVRRNFQDDGDTLVDTHGLHRVAPRDVAKRMHVHFVDANQITHDLEQGLGREASKKLHMWFSPGEVSSLPEGRHDNTHYNVYGAHQVAKLLADALADEIPLLRKYRVDADITVDRQGRGDYMELEQAIAAAQTMSKQQLTIQILGGEWTMPKLSKKPAIRFVLREGATWK